MYSASGGDAAETSSQTTNPMVKLFCGQFLSAGINEGMIHSPWLRGILNVVRLFVRSFVLSLLWTPALRLFEWVQCASPGRGGELIGVCGVSAM